MKDSRLRPCIAQGDFEGNMDIIMQGFAKTAFLFPNADSIKLYGADSYNYRGDATKSIKVLATETALAVTKSASTTDYTMTLSGEVPKQTAAILAAVFGATPTETHATVVLIEIPTKEISKLTVKHGSTTMTLAAGDIIEINNRFYLVRVLGLYDNSGTVTATVTAITVTFGVLTVKYAVALSSATLQA
jgi:hypothetical protein